MKGLVHAALLTAMVLAPAESLDWRVERAVQRGRSPALETPMRLATRVGQPLVVCGGLVGVALLDRTQGLATLGALAFALIPTNLAVEGLKRAVDRTRPDGEHKRSNASFPSSHAANAFALAWVLGRRWRRAAPALFAFAAVVAFSRLYLDRHFLTDVLAGAGIGLVCGWAATRCMARLRRDRAGAPAAGEARGA